MRAVIFAAGLVLTPLAALAHERQCDGAKVPEHVKLSCCGKADAHFLRPDQYERESGGSWAVASDGHEFHIADDRAEPSEDGCAWIFYSDSIVDGSGQPKVWCFQIPMAF